MPLAGLLEMMNHQLTEWIEAFIDDIEGKNAPSDNAQSVDHPIAMTAQSLADLICPSDQDCSVQDAMPLAGLLEMMNERLTE